jgi:hypothetical protein
MSATDRLAPRPRIQAAAPTRIDPRGPCARPQVARIAPADSPGSGMLVAGDIVETRVVDELEPYDPRERTRRIIDDVRDRAESVLSGRVDLTPEPKVDDYEDPFAVEGMQED